MLPVLVLLVIAFGAVAGLGVRELSARPSAGGQTTVAPTSTAPAGPPPGSSSVQLSPDAAAHPAAEEIRVLLQRHFDAINSLDYAAWASTVVARRSAEMPRKAWEAAYESTRDGSILVHRIEPAPDGHVVLMSFVSTQDADKAPANLQGSTCTRWWVSYRVVTESRVPRIDAGDRHSSLNADCS